jgi:AcrR family transcriptional regulator
VINEMAAKNVPMRRLGRPPATDSAETRERLLLAARRAFATIGFDATTNRDIATEVGITTGAIYHYFPSKAELYLAVYEEVNELVYCSFDKAAAQHEAFVDRFGAVLDSAVELNRDDPSLAAFVVGVAAEAQHHPDLAALIQPQVTRGSSFLHGLVSDAVRRDELADDIDPGALEDLLNSVLSGLARFSNITCDAGRHRGAAEVLKRFLAGTAIVTPTS